MADFGNSQPSRINHKHPISSFFSSPRLFSGFISKTSPNNDTESITSSPTSILDSKPFSSPKTPNQQNRNFRILGLVDALIDEKSDSNPSKMVLFGSQLKIQVPPLPPSVLSPNESPKSPCDFGIKTRNSQLGPFSPNLAHSPAKKSPFGSSNSCPLSSLSATEMELSEDYTCVISYGPNPRTTHIFDDCVVESCCGVVKFSESRKENVFDRPMSYDPSESFLSFCYNCRKNLGQGKDIYMYRGEKAFCSNECRYREMMLEEEDSELVDVYGTSS